MNDDQKNEALENALPAAAEGVRASIVEVLRAFYTGPLFVPRRAQAHPMSDSPAYPDELIDLLGVKDSERVIVPVFSRAVLIEEWCGVSLEYRVMSGEHFVRAIPATWWACINPGSDIQKELSPWEIAELHHGEEGIETITSEIVESAEPAEPLIMVPLAAGEQQGLCDALRKFGADAPWIDSLTLAAIPPGHRSSFGEVPLVLSVVTKDGASEEQRAALNAAVRLACMGEVPPRILWNDQSSAFGAAQMASSIPALFEREKKRGFLQRIFARSRS